MHLALASGLRQRLTAAWKRQHILARVGIVGLVSVKLTFLLLYLGMLVNFDTFLPGRFTVTALISVAYLSVAADITIGMGVILGIRQRRRCSADRR
jgi:hypothetical protein